MVCQSKIIVRTEIDHLAPADGNFAALRGRDHALTLHEAFGFDLIQSFGNVGQKVFGHACLHDSGCTSIITD